MAGDPILLTLALGSLAAFVASAGTLPFLFTAQPPRRLMGAAYALPSGVMIGAAYLLGSEGLGRDVPAAAVGALLGVFFIFRTQSFTEAAEEEAPTDPAADPAAGYRQILQDSLHSASEGVAIAVAMAVSLSFGTFLALALAIHNVGEALGLTEFLQKRGVSLGECAGLAVAAKLSQPLFAVSTLAILTSVPQLTPAALGLAAGALFSLVLGELVPAAYGYAGHRIIAVLLTGSAAAVIFFEDLLL